MNFGQKFVSMVSNQCPILSLTGNCGHWFVFLGFKREFSKLIGFLVIALIAVGLVFNASGVKDVLLNLFNRIVGA